MFNPQNIRRSRQKLAVITDSSYRFEHGVSYEICDFANRRAIELFTKYTNARFIYRSDVYKKEYVPQKIVLSQEYVNKILNTNYSLKDISDTLSRLGMDIHFTTEFENKIIVDIPSFRMDIREEIDLVEEIARLQGYENIPTILRTYRSEVQIKEPVWILEQKIRNFLCSQGIYEVINYSLIKDWKYYDTGLVEIQNPVSAEWRLLRPSLLSGLLKNIVHNYNNNRTKNMKFFELGKVFNINNSKYVEKEICSIICTGTIYEQHWEHKPDKINFYYIAGILEKLIKEIGCETKLAEYQNQTNNVPLIPEKSALLVSSKNQNIVYATLGLLNPEIHQKDFDQEMFYAEIYLEELIPDITKETIFKPYSNLPKSERDLSVIVPEQLPYNTVIDKIMSLQNDVINIEIRLFDVYKNIEKIGKEKKSFAFTLYFSNTTRTLTSNEVNDKMNEIIKELGELGVSLRG